MTKTNKIKYPAWSLLLMIGIFIFALSVPEAKAYFGLSIGTSTRNMAASENLIYGITGASNDASSNFILFQKSGPTNLFKVGYDGGGYFMGSVGIGTTSPATKLNIFGTSNTVRMSYDATHYGELSADSSGNNLWHSTGFVQMAGDNAIGDLSGQAGSDLIMLGDPSGTTGKGIYIKAFNTSPYSWYTGIQYLNVASEIPNLVLVPSGGKVGIGTSSPTNILHIYNANGIRIQSTTGNGDLTVGGQTASGLYSDSSNLGLRGVSSGGTFVAPYNGALGTGLYINSTGYLGVGTTTITSALASFNYLGGTGASIDAGGSRIQNLATPINDTDALTKGTASSTFWSDWMASPMRGNFDMGGGTHNIVNVNKITANTYDPLYNIKGVNYSTFAPAIAGGVKEEYVGQARIDSYRAGAYEYVIDFSDLAVGSDLWVWRQIIDFSPDKVQVFLTPYGGFAQTYYLIKDNQLIFRSDKPIKVSYRLVANRFDWLKWPTKPLDQSEKAGLIIK